MRRRERGWPIPPAAPRTVTLESYSDSIVSNGSNTDTNIVFIRRPGRRSSAPAGETYVARRGREGASLDHGHEHVEERAKRGGLTRDGTESIGEEQRPEVVMRLVVSSLNTEAEVATGEQEKLALWEHHGTLGRRGLVCELSAEHVRNFEKDTDQRR